jgi:hypothetical protein
MVMAASQMVLELWERAADCPPRQRGLAILAAACPEFGTVSRTVGECESQLLAIHEALFGSQLNGFARCPQCGEALELALDIATLRDSAASRPDDCVWRQDGFNVEYRALTVADVVDASACNSVEEAYSLLLRRAVVACSRDGRSMPVHLLPPVVMEQLAVRLGESDPLAECVLDLACPACEHQWSVLLDTTSLLWTEIRMRVARLLREVHALAAAYGWSEGDVLALSPRRREAYLGMVGA